jgi:hypothetical protein
MNIDDDGYWPMTMMVMINKCRVMKVKVSSDDDVCVRDDVE